jgi:hypothetical protein
MEASLTAPALDPDDLQHAAELLLQAIDAAMA